MPTESSVEILPSELAQIVESVFETMLSLEVSESETPWFPGGDRLTSAVHLAGDWNGAVLLECDRAAGLPLRRPLPLHGSARDGGRRRARRARRTGQHDRRQPEVLY